jgi:hypothetical protein
MTMIGLRIAVRGAAQSQQRLNNVAANMGKSIRQAMYQEAHLLRRMIVVGIRRQAPGGQRLRPLKPATIKAKGGKSKALIDKGDYIRSINVKEIGGGVAYFVGVHKEARNDKGESLANIGEVLEFGTRDRRIKPLPHLRPSFAKWKVDTGKRALVRLVASLGLERMAVGLGRKILTDSSSRGFRGNLTARFSKSGRLSWRLS